MWGGGRGASQTGKDLACDERLVALISRRDEARKGAAAGGGEEAAGEEGRDEEEEEGPLEPLSLVMLTTGGVIARGEDMAHVYSIVQARP